MNGAQLKGFRLSAADHAMGANYDATRITITKTPGGFEVRRGGKLVGTTETSAGARELVGAL